MSIRKAKLDGKYVYADEGEKLRNMDVVCMNCGAKMHVHRFPERDEYYFALNPGEKHTSICQDYDGAKEAPVITGESPDQLIDIISTVSKSSGGGTSPGTGSGLKGRTGGEVDYSPKKLTKISQIIKTGMYDENPFEQTFHDSQYRFIDFLIFDKWGRYIWKNSKLVNIGARIIDARWVGSFKVGPSNREKIVKKMKRTKEIWFCMFWQAEEGFVSVRFCLDCEACFSDIKTRKLFKSGMNDNGSYYDFVPKIDKLDVLIGARWATMDKEQCGEKCPWKKCDGCLGAYWGKCNTVKQVELFPANELTKNKEKKIDE